jgi:hypothetical protein
METTTEETIAAAYHELALEFVVELMQVTQGASSQTAFQQALQGYVDALRPWLQDRDLPETPRDTFSLFVPCEDRESDDDLSVHFTPEGEALFRAWVRRQAVVLSSVPETLPERGH